jgi:hypothetical protein
MNAPRILAGRAGGGFPLLASAARDMLKITKQWICPRSLPAKDQAFRLYYNDLRDETWSRIRLAACGFTT